MNTTMDLKRSTSEDDASSSLRDSGISLSDETLEEEILGEDEILGEEEIIEKKRKWRKAPKKYDCAICDKEFKGLTDLKRHLLIHSNEKPYKCDMCEKSYRQKVNLNYHIKMVHSNEKEFICGFCKKPFAYKQRLRLHLRTHTGEKPYCCQYCTSTFARSGQLKLHLETHEANKYNCEICSSTFTSERKLKCHMARHGDEPNRICQICKKAFMNSKIMQAHMIRVHSHVEQFECPICELTITTEDLQTHMKVHNPPKRYKCEHCEAAFVQKCQYKVHLRKHTGERPFQCKVCWMAFAHNSVLKLHIRKHTGEKPIKCLLCKDSYVAFSQLAHLKTHMRTIHKKENSYACEGCKECFKVKFHLDSHMEACKKYQILKGTSDPLEIDENTEKDTELLTRLRYLIAVLIKNISTPEKLTELGFGKRLIDNVLMASLKIAKQKCFEKKKMHELDRLKLNIESFLEWIVPQQMWAEFKNECSAIENILDKIVTMYLKQVCWMAFAHNSVLKLHIRKHTGEKPIKCLLCKDSYVAFSQLAHLKTHMRTIHKKENSYACEGCKECFKVKFHLDSHMEACKKYQILKGTSDPLEIDENTEKDTELLTRLRYLIAVLIKNISTPEKLTELGFGKRLIDNVLMASLKIAKQKCFEKKKMHELDRLKLNIESFLEWIVPQQMWAEFKNECSAIENILDKIVTMYLKQVCWMAFAHNSVLKLHIRKHTGEKPIKCLLCKDSYVAFSQLAHLKTHMRTIHKKENSYACEGCKECFKVKFHLDSHMEACKKYQILKGTSDPLEIDENTEKDTELLTRLRYLIAVLIKNISTPEKLTELGFGKRLIDNVLMASLKIAKQKCFEKKKMHELDRLKLNIESFLEWIVPQQMWAEFKNECSAIENILDKIVTMYLKQVE